MSESELFINSDEQRFAIEVDSNTTWDVSEECDWLRIDRKDQTYSEQFTVYVTENSSTKVERTAEIIVSSENVVEERIYIYQEPKSTLELNKYSLEFECIQDHELSFSVTSSNGWEIVEYPIWLDFSRYEYSSNGLATTQVKVTTNSDNNTGKIKTGTILIESGSKEVRLEVSQQFSDKIPEDFVVINTELDYICIGATGGFADSISISSSTKWSVNADVEWINFDRESGYDGENFTPIIDPNDGVYREGIISISCGSSQTKIIVKQYGNELMELVPIVTALSVSPTAGTLNTTYTFTATAEDTNKVFFYVSGYQIGEVYSEDGEFVCSYNKFTKGGDRIVYAYPADNYGNEVRSSGSYLTEEFAITTDGKLSPVEILTESDQQIALKSSFDLNWIDDNNKNIEGVSYNVYVWNNGEQTGKVINTESSKVIIPASYFQKEGRHIIGVFAISETCEASDIASMVVYINVEKPYIEDLEPTVDAIPMGSDVGLLGQIYGNGGKLTQISIKIYNSSNGAGGLYKTYFVSAEACSLDDLVNIKTTNKIFSAPGKYTVKVYALKEGAIGEEFLGQVSLNVTSGGNKITLDKPILGSTNAIAYGDNYTIGWNYDANVDYYEIAVSGLTYKKTVSADETSFTIPFSVFKQYLSTSGSNFTITVTARSNDTEHYLSSAAAKKEVFVSGVLEETAIIKSVTLPGRKNNEVIAGETVVFCVVTSTDVAAIRMKDGDGSFVINTWNSEYEDSGDERIWTVEQRVSYAGGENVDYVNRSLTFYSMINDVEYNKCNVAFKCVKKDVVGAFSITNPKYDSQQTSGKDLTITWTTPDTGADYYVINITHNGVNIDESVFPFKVETETSYTLDGKYLVSDSNAWYIQITACKNGMADTYASGQFVLECSHGKLGEPKKKYLSYKSNDGDSVSVYSVLNSPYNANAPTGSHTSVVENVYPCLDCGKQNAKTEAGTAIENHSYIVLDEGGQVCNRCWHIVSDGYQNSELYTLKGSQNVPAYFDIDKNGNPYGYQYNEKNQIRKVFVEDEIRILGYKGNVCLIQYEVGVGYWWAFMETDMLQPIQQQTTTVDANLNGTIIHNVIYSNYDSKYYCSLIDAVNAFNGNCKTLDGILKLSVEIWNPFEEETYTASCDMRNLSGSNVYFTAQNGDSHTIWGSVRNKEIYIELEEFCTSVCGAKKISDTVYAIDYDVLDQIKKGTKIVEVVSDLTNNVKYHGVLCYDSFDKNTIQQVNVAQGILDAITFDWDFYNELYRKLYNYTLYSFIPDEKLNDLAPIIQKYVKICRGTLIDPIRKDVLMEIIDISEESALQTILNYLNAEVQTRLDLYEFLNDSLGNCADFLNVLLKTESLPFDKANELLKKINSIVQSAAEAENNSLLEFDGKEFKSVIPDELGIAIELVTTVAEFVYGYWVYSSNAEAVDYLLSLRPYLSEYDKQTLDCIVNINKQFDLTYLLTQILAGCGWEAIDSLLLSKLSKFPLVVIPQLVGKSIEAATGNKADIESLNKQTVARSYIDAVARKAHDTAIDHRNGIEDIKQSFMDLYMWLHINKLMNDESLKYVNNRHKGPVYIISKYLLNMSVYSPKEYSRIITDENSEIDTSMKYVKNIMLNFEY